MIRYSAEAEADVRRLHDWLFERNQNAALRLLEAIRDAVDTIATTPHALQKMKLDRPDDTFSDLAARVTNCTTSKMTVT